MRKQCLNSIQIRVSDNFNYYAGCKFFMQHFFIFKEDTLW